METDGIIVTLDQEKAYNKIRHDYIIETLQKFSIPDIYEIPGLTQWITINLYVDNTTIFLKKGDSYKDLQDILQKWCLASGAKFNLEKTEILLIGMKKHREEIITTRKLNAEDQSWNNNIRLAKDGMPIRSLGAWIGNKVNNTTPWEPVLDKIKQRLLTWKKSHPTLNGKQLIVQMVVGGMTQFLTKAQGMPK
ncbi:hypothetical protein BDR04DRAFT_1126301 [Suillus decipiens]|nr:hypothetical protein BDR04DRAFT_1126301 [Suillus decipiens]